MDENILYEMRDTILHSLVHTTLVLSLLNTFNGC